MSSNRERKREQEDSEGDSEIRKKRSNKKGRICETNEKKMDDVHTRQRDYNLDALAQQSRSWDKYNTQRSKEPIG